MALLAAVGLGVFIIPHDWARMVGAGMFGFASAFAFVLNLVLPPLLAETSGDVHRISAGMFTIGYGDVRSVVGIEQRLHGQLSGFLSFVNSRSGTMELSIVGAQRSD
jgi:hypothetical protein